VVYIERNDLIDTMKKKYVVIITLFFCLFLNGCASIALSFRDHKDENIKSNIYIGTRAEYKTLTFGRYKDGKDLLANIVVWPIALIDFPLCLVADTLLLPYTLFTIKDDNDEAVNSVVRDSDNHDLNIDPDIDPDTDPAIDDKSDSDNDSFGI